MLDAVMNLGYYKRTMFAMRVFVPILGSSQIDTKVTKQIRVIRRRRLPKSVQTVVGEGRVDGNEGSEMTGDDDGGEEVPLLLTEVIEYVVKTETLEM